MKEAILTCRLSSSRTGPTTRRSTSSRHRLVRSLATMRRRREATHLHASEFIHAHARVRAHPPSEGLDVSEEDRAFVTDHFTLSVLGHVCQWLATGMSADPFLLTERISRVLRGQVRRALTLFAEDPSSSAPRG